MVWFVLGHSGQRTSVKCAEAAWNYKAGGIVHLKSPAFFFFFKSPAVLIKGLPNQALSFLRNRNGIRILVGQVILDVQIKILFCTFFTIAPPQFDLEILMSFLSLQ